MPMDTAAVQLPPYKAKVLPITKARASTNPHPLKALLAVVAIAALVGFLHYLRLI